MREDNRRLKLHRERLRVPRRIGLAEVPAIIFAALIENTGQIQAGTAQVPDLIDTPSVRTAKIQWTPNHGWKSATG